MHHHITVVGGGYAGVLALGRLRMQEPNARLTLVDPGTHFEARIQLHRVAAGGTAPHRAYAELCAAWGAEHVKEKLVRVEGRSLTLETQTLEPDAAVLALGSRTRPAPGPAHTLDDDASARRLAEELECRPDARVTVIGAGTTALEAATALATAHPRARITLWRRNGWPTSVGAEHLDRRLQQLGVVVVDGGRLLGIARTHAWSEHTEVAHDCVLWCGGFLPSRVPGLDAGWPDGRVAVDPFLHLGDGVFAAGDLACPPRAHRLGCVTAMPTGAHAAANLSRWLSGEPLKAFGFRDVLTCIDLAQGHGLVRTSFDASGSQRVFGGRLAGLTKAAILLGVRALPELERRTGWPLYGWAQGATPPRLAETA